jgi:hypothetical protein
MTAEQKNHEAALALALRELLKATTAEHVKKARDALRAFDDENERADWDVYVAKEISLVQALWHFIENVGDDHPRRTEIFFILRERMRTEPHE